MRRDTASRATAERQPSACAYRMVRRSRHGRQATWSEQHVHCESGSPHPRATRRQPCCRCCEELHAVAARALSDRAREHVERGRIVLRHLLALRKNLLMVASTTLLVLHERCAVRFARLTTQTAHSPHEQA